MKLLAFGQTGQVARELAGLGVQTLGRTEADLTDPEGCAAAIAGADVEGVINAAAYTAVDRAETEEALALRINADAPGAMARACAAKGVPFVHISTDYVFDGSGDAPRKPDDPVAPISAYGRTKLAGEMAVRAAGGVHGILRTSWVFSAHGTNFVKTMLRLGSSNDQLSIVADQVGGPTPARAIAGACVTMVATLQQRADASGTYHFSGSPDTSWSNFARAIFAEAGLSCAVEDIPSEAYPTPARRPRNSRLDCSLTEEVFALKRPDWRTGLAEVLRDCRSTE
jgi:dTDP-4-dehydrorhamnose reductase